MPTETYKWIDKGELRSLMIQVYTFTDDEVEELYISLVETGKWRWSCRHPGVKEVLVRINVDVRFMGSE